MRGVQMLCFFSRAAGILMATVLLAACQTLGGAGLVSSTATINLSPEAASAIADDMVGHLLGQIGPGNTTIALMPDGSEFGSALEGSLRTSGYAVVTDQKANTIEKVPLAYVVDDFEGSVLVRLSTMETDLTRIYKLSGAGADPISPLSVRARDQAGL